MDLLAKRYANPYLVLDDFIRNKQLHEFTETVFKDIAEEKVYDARWEYYLHKVWDMTFEEYVFQCEHPEPEKHGMQPKEIGNLMDDSKNMLNGFVPA